MGTVRELKRRDMRAPERVVVAMSGGVDSSMAAALLKEAGYEVIGVMMRLWVEEKGRANRCCTPEAVESARQMARLLGFPFRLLDYRERFKERVVDYFIKEYSRGRTPNPCLVCNRFIKFRALLRHAVEELGARYLATGHYARIRQVNGSYQLLKGVDPSKDQSYVLYMLGQWELAHLLFPIGDYTKEQVRAMARARGFPVANREESQELCFVADNDYRRFLHLYAPEAIRPGPILDRKGRILGEHKGLPFYTIGQREGLGIAYSEPLYVLEIDLARNALVVGTRKELGKRHLVASEVSFIAGHPPAGPLRVEAKIRYRAPQAPALLTPLGDDRVKVSFDEPQRDITPGQAVVFYQGEIVLGGGIIEAAF